MNWNCRGNSRHCVLQATLQGNNLKQNRGVTKVNSHNKICEFFSQFLVCQIRSLKHMDTYGVGWSSPVFLLSDEICDENLYFQIAASFLWFHFNLYFIWKVVIKIKHSSLLIPQDAASLILISCLHIMNVKIKLNILAKHHFVSNDNPRSVIYTDPCLEKASICMHCANKVYNCSSCIHALASSCVKMQVC